MSHSTLALRGCLVFVALWATMLIYGAVADPVPGVNEPHYLGKAKHFWNPEWCAGDLLYESSNAHGVFYFVTGYWAKWLTLPQLAWAGRAVGYALLAIGWLRAHAALELPGWRSWWSLLGFLMLASWGNLSGEWIVGGIEGKVVSYGFLLLAFAEWQAGRPYRATLFAGLAISFHPIAGGWAVLAALLAEVGLRNRKRWGRSDVVAGGILILAMLPGLIPALALLFAQDPPSIRRNATVLQVFYRLKHHLDPMDFPWEAWSCYAGLAVTIVAGLRILSSTAAGTRWLWIVGWSAMFAIAGLIAGAGPRPADEMPFYTTRMILLKFYPFRLLDVLAPLTAVMLATRIAIDWLATRSGGVRITSGVLSGVMLLVLLTAGEYRREMLESHTPFETPEWRDVCRWVRENTPPSVLVQTPVFNPNFKWYAQRAEFVSYKDMPQDNRSLIEWNRRLLLLRKWYEEHHADGVYSNDEMRSLRDETGITLIVTDRLGPFELPPRYTNSLFRVYDLTTLDDLP